MVLDTSNRPSADLVSMQLRKYQLRQLGNLRAGQNIPTRRSTLDTTRVRTIDTVWADTSRRGVYVKKSKIVVRVLTAKRTK